MIRGIQVKSCFAAGLALLLSTQLFSIQPFASASELSGELQALPGGEAYYVSADLGDDLAGDGSLANPWASIQRAADIAEAGDTVFIREGVYRETVTPVNSGSEQSSIVYRNYDGEEVVIDGTEPVTGWQSEGGGVYSAELLLPLGHGNQVFDSGEMMIEARWPNHTGGLLSPTFAIMSAGTPTTITTSELPAGIDPVGASVWFRGGSGWAGLDSVITAYNTTTSTMTMEPVGSTGTHYDARAGNPFFLWGKQEFLDAEKEWWYDEQAEKLFYIPPGGGMPEDVEAKVRTLSFDLTGKSHIELVGLHTRANTILTDEASSHLLFEGLKLEYVSHMTRTPNKDGRPPDLYRGMQLKGSDHVLRNSELAYSSSGLLFVTGSNHTIINNYLHDGNYLGTWGGLVTLGGQEHYVGYNTMTRAGRDVINMGGASKIILEHNDLSHGAQIVNDTGMVYMPNTDGMGTEIRYNKVHHSNPNAHLGIGIYLDNFTRNYIIHHNVIWNIPNSDPIRLNAPSNFNLVYNNTMATNTRTLSTSGARYGGDMYGVRLFNNIINDTVNYISRSDLAHGNNIFISAGQDPLFVDADNLDFRLTPGSPAVDSGMVIPGITDGYSGSAPDIGAYELGQSDFIAGHDFDASPVPNRSFSITPYANRVINSGFETYQLDPWVTVSGTPEVINAGGAAWSSDDADSRSHRASLRLGGEQGEVEQTVTGLEPNTPYSFSVWSKVTDDSATAEFGVREFGGAPVTGTNDSTGWTFATVDFVTGPTDTSATVFLRKTAGATAGGQTLFPLDEGLIPAANESYLYDVTSFIQAERAGDGVASLIMKVKKSSVDKRVTFATREAANSERRPELIITYADDSVQALQPMEDAGVKYRDTAGYTDTNTGGSSSLNVSYHNDGFIENMYLKFDLSALQSQDIADVQLRMYVVSKNTASNPVSTSVYGLADDSWQETQLVWENRPEEISAAEGLVYFDDAGLILPLGDEDPAALIRDRLLEAQLMVQRYKGSDEIASAVIADMEATIAAVSSQLHPSPPLPELLQHLEMITSKVAAFRVREQLAELIREVRQAHDAAQEGEQSGHYFPGAKAELLAAVQAALAVSNSPTADEAAVGEAMTELQQARAQFMGKLVLQEVALLEKADMGAMLADASRWSATFGSNDGFAAFTGTISKYNEIIGDKVFTFGLNYTYVDDTEWPGLVLRSQNPSLPVLGSGDTSYFILFKKNVWELQKRINGTQIYLKSFPNVHLNSGVTSKVDTGAIDVEGGVRIFMYVDGSKVFDLIDTQDPIGPGYMGFVPQGGKSNGIHVRKDETPELTLQGPAVVTTGEAFTMEVRIDHVDDLAATGIEFELTYDDALMTVLGTEVLTEGMTVTEEVAAEGELRLSMEMEGEPSLLNAGDGLIRLNLQAKGQTALTSLKPVGARMMRGEEQPIEAVMYEKVLWIAQSAGDPVDPVDPPPGTGSGGGYPVAWPDVELPEAELPDESGEGVRLSPEGGQYQLLDGEVQLRLPPGVLDKSSEIIVDRLPSPPQDGALRPVSLAYKLELGEDSRWPDSMSVAISYDPALLNGTDVRKLGIYRKDEMGAWTYQGGIVDLEAQTVMTRLDAPGTYAVMTAEITYADVSGHWAREAVEVLAARHLVSGVAADRFEPNRRITRAEFAKLIVELVKELERYHPLEDKRETGTPAVFADVNESVWYAEYVRKASAWGLILGANGHFRPNDSITRQEMMVIIARALAQGEGDQLDTETTLRPFRDASALSEWSRPAAAYLVQVGLIQGDNLNLHPSRSTTRAEAATLLLNVLDKQGNM